MHGVKRVRYSKEALEARKQKEQSRLKEYLTLTGDLLSRRKLGDKSKEVIEKTRQLLLINPEFYTIWNYRREIFAHLFPNITPPQVNGYLSQDLDLTTVLLKQYPKVYWIWNHRRWCLENVPDVPAEEEEKEGGKDGWRIKNWKKELFVVEKMLEADARNFHAWNYRRYVLASMPPQAQRSELSELAYTTRKIEANFSNFSAWHQRSKVLASLWEAGKLDPVKSKEEELDLVKNAMYTDPGDQSVWIYHRWLIGKGNDAPLLKREIAVIQELLDEQPDSKWCMESIVYYKRLLIHSHSSLFNEEEINKLRDDCLSSLRDLAVVDPARKQRYKELAENL